MENKRQLDKRPKRLYENTFVVVLFVIATIVCSGHAFYTMSTNLPIVTDMLAIFCVIPITGVLMNRRVDASVGAFLIVVSMTLIALALDMGLKWAYYVTVLTMVFTAFGFSHMYSFQSMVKLYLRIMTVVTIVGIIGHLLVNNTSVLSFLPTFSSNNDFDYQVGIIFNSMVQHPERNCGMFWEPGLFATYLTLAMVFEILFNPWGKPNVWRLLLFAVGILTTTSSAGYVLMVLCVILWLTRREGKRKKDRNSALVSTIKFALFFIAILALMNYEVILDLTGLANDEYVNKLLPENIADSSRMRAVFHNFEMFFESPLFGVGAARAFRDMEAVCDTSTSTFALSVFGLPGISYTFYWLYAIFKDKTLNVYSKVVFAAIILSILNKEPHLTLLFTWCLLFWLLRRVVEQKEAKA